MARVVNSIHGLRQQHLLRVVKGQQFVDKVPLFRNVDEIAGTAEITFTDPNPSWVDAYTKMVSATRGEGYLTLGDTKKNSADM